MDVKLINPRKKFDSLESSRSNNPMTKRVPIIRGKRAPKTKAKLKPKAKPHRHPWTTLDWTKPNRVLRKELGADVAWIKKNRKRYAPETIGQEPRRNWK